MFAFERLAEEKIQEAIAAGELDNLRSKGKPLNLDEYASLHPEQRMTYIVLKNSGFMPLHLQYRRELEKQIVALQLPFSSYGQSWRIKLQLVQFPPRQSPRACAQPRP